MSGEGVLDSKKPQTAVKTPRRSKKDDRMDKLENSLNFLIKIVTKQYPEAVPENVNNGTNVENTSTNLKNGEESAHKRKLIESSAKSDLASPGPSKKSSKVDEHKESKTEIICDVSPTDILLSKNDRRSKERESDDIQYIPKFDGKAKNISVKDWLIHLELTGKKYSWDEGTLIGIMKKNLDGDMLQWVVNQSDMNISWEQWKTLLVNKCHSIYAQDQVDKLQEFVSTYRRQKEKVIEFCRLKRKQGESLGLSDQLICNVIIHRLRHPYLEEYAHKMGCKDTRTLLKYLSEHFSESGRDWVVCSICGRRGHTTSQCYGPCKHCNRTGHRSEFCIYK